MCDFCPEPPPEKWSIEELRKEMNHRLDRAHAYRNNAKEEERKAEEFRKIIRNKLRNGERF